MQKIIWMGKDELRYISDAAAPAKKCRADEVLLRVIAVGLCTTDVHIIRGKYRVKDPPHVLGHEVTGVVEDTGTSVGRVRAGDRVTVDSVIGCGKCALCARGSAQYCPDGSEVGMTIDGGMQEYIIIPERNVIPIPDSISDEVSAIMDAEVLGALRKPGIEKGSSLLVIGPGPGGLIAIQIGRILGAGKVILLGTRPERLELGRKLGADITISLSSGSAREEILEAAGGIGPDMVFDAAGTPSSVSLALDVVRPQGKVVLYGVHGVPVPSFNIDVITLKDLVVYGALSDRVGWEDMIEWVGSGKLNLRDIITHRFSFRDAQKAYETVRDRKDGAIKAVLMP